MIFSVGGFLPARTLFSTVRLMPCFRAHTDWLPARSTSVRSNRTMSFGSSTRMLVFKVMREPRRLATSEAPDWQRRSESGWKLLPVRAGR
jgi:hypothetical protein